jgi:AcrR family transcriptional regulator
MTCGFVPALSVILGIPTKVGRGLFFIHCIFNGVKDIIRRKRKWEGCLPRKADARLEGRILDAAYRLLSESGEDALTMRAVASACGTTTPTLYERFSNKEGLLSLLRRRARLNLFSAIKSARSPEEVCRRVLDFFAAHPNDFRLISEDWAIAFARKEHLPSFEFLKQSLSNQFGGQPDQHTPVALALVALLHGTATLLHSVDIHKKISRDFRSACISACEALMRAACPKDAS